MTDIHSHYDDMLREVIDQATAVDISTSDATIAMKNLKIFSECRTLLNPPDPEPDPTPVPKTRWEKVKAGTSAVWDNETTRVFIKAGGAFAGVALVAWSTIHKDHVMERQALAQANQRPS